MTDVRPIRPAVDADLVTALEEWLEMARRGDLVGAVLLGNLRGDECTNRLAGLMPLPTALVTFEWFKRRAFERIERRE